MSYDLLPALRASLKYDPETGEFYRVRGTRGHAAGKAGSIGSNGYIVVGLKGRPRLAHRLAWLYMKEEWPEMQIDHINGDKTDNRWENLRQVDSFQNHKNKKRLKSNTSGVSGVCLKRRKWEANIRPDNKYIHLGVFEDWFEAVCARKSAEVKFNFHTNHGR